jgi:phosphopantothenoylcysteine decarboxylase/phosphopantothenate--cysteine ligase
MTENEIPLCNTLLLGVTGAIAAAWLPARIYAMRDVFAHNIFVLMSRTAPKFITPYALTLLSGNRVFVDGLDCEGDVKVPHTELPRRANIFLIMPATANILASCASGRCDGLISTAVVATPLEVPIVFVPSMNEIMWTNRAVQNNVRTLRELGHHVVEPECGSEVADRRDVYGGMASLRTVAEALKTVLRYSKMIQ